MDTEDYFEANRYVKELKPSDFKKGVPWELKISGDSKCKKAMVLFYAPWCGHCKQVKKPWSEAATLSGFCDFYAFNCERYKNHLSKIKDDIPHLVTGFPTIIIYKNGSPEEYYNGERTVKGFSQTCMDICHHKG
jgi:thiol-disulfide isomerase/thioredoxin